MVPQTSFSSQANHGTPVRGNRQNDAVRARCRAYQLYQPRTLALAARFVLEWVRDQQT